MYRHILIPTDGSEFAEKAIHYVLRLPRSKERK
jgi:nucleotide-binding universal stress UspA family protein